MIKNVLTTLGGVENYGIISICLFFVTFLGAVVWALLQKKTVIHHMERLPLDGGEIPSGAPRHE